MTFEQHAAVLDRLVADFKGDKGAKGLPRILRVPGFLNWKYGEPQLVAIEYGYNNGYTAAEIVDAFPPVANSGRQGASAVRAADRNLPASLSIPRSAKRHTLEAIAEALTHLEADDRAVWVDYGHALKRDHDEAGFDVWDEWSATSKLYDAADTRKRWDGFDVSDKGQNKITCGTIIANARAAGWKGAAPTFEVAANDSDAPIKIEWPDPKGNSADPNSGKNTSAYLEAHKIRPWFNEFDQTAYLSSFPSTAVPLTDDTALDLRMKMHDAGMRCGKDLSIDRITWSAHQSRRHPIKTYLDALTWDRVPRIDMWLHSIVGAEDTKYHALVGAKFLIAAVRRVRDPGCKFDQALTLEGRQGARNSAHVIRDPLKIFD